MDGDDSRLTAQRPNFTDAGIMTMRPSPGINQPALNLMDVRGWKQSFGMLSVHGRTMPPYAPKLLDDLSAGPWAWIHAPQMIHAAPPALTAVSRIVE